MDKETKMYEIGYLLSPLIPEEKLDEEISILRKLIEDRQGLITNEERGKSRRLAYTIKNPATGKFDTAYFGWMKFIAAPESISVVKESFDKAQNLIRFLIIEAFKEDIVKRPARKPIREKKAPIEPAIKTEVKPEEIDKKIEELLGN